MSPAPVLDDWPAALLDPRRPAPAGLRAWNGSDPAPRFDVYRNNVVVGLVAALADSFTVVQALVGTAFFATMARHFVQAHPPRSPILATYGDALPGFIAGYAPAAALPYLADVARLEYIRVQAYHAAEAPAMTPARLAAQLAQPASLPVARCRLHPSLHVVDSAYPIVDLWAAHQGRGELAGVDLDRPQAALVARAGDDVVVLAVPRPAARFLQAVLDGATLAAAVDAAAAAPAPDGKGLDLGTALALLLEHGWLSDWHGPENPT